MHAQRARKLETRDGGDEERKGQSEGEHNNSWLEESKLYMFSLTFGPTSVHWCSETIGQGNGFGCSDRFAGSPIVFKRSV